MTQIAPFQYTISAGDRITITHPGSWVTVTKGDYPFQISTDKGSSAQLERGLGVELEPFSQLYIHNTADYAQTIQLYIGDAYVRDSRLSVPSDTVVGVVDGSTVRSFEGKAFVGRGYKGAVAAQYAHVQLWNPATSEKEIYVKTIRANASTVPVDVQFRVATSGLADFFSNPPSKNFSLSADSEREVRTESNSTLGAGAGVPIMYMRLVTAAVYETFQFSEPVCITPGTGLVCCLSTVNVGHNVIFEYYEST